MKHLPIRVDESVLASADELSRRLPGGIGRSEVMREAISVGLAVISRPEYMALRFAGWTPERMAGKLVELAAKVEEGKKVGKLMDAMQGLPVEPKG